MVLGRSMPGTVWAIRMFRRLAGGTKGLLALTTRNFPAPLPKTTNVQFAGPRFQLHLYMDFAILVNFAKPLNLEVEAVD